MRPRLLAFLLFLSGAGALVLEVAWFRRTAQVAGATSVAMAGVLAAVIGGMAIGAHLLGRVADRSRDPLRLYALLEAGVALGAVLSPTLLDLARPAFDAATIPVRFLLATAILAPPAVL
ncbi:MAG: spermidine synthase, partial [Planctomycetes bacterium]|nr:spermidine synthase [Planctomycetota bacterium]